MDRVKESIFNVLGPGVRELRVLDLFAGSGSLGLEAVSRGAHNVTFVDQDPKAIQVILKNLKTLHIDEKSYQLLQLKWQAAFKRLHRHNDQFDLVLMDPPYSGLVDIGNVLLELVDFDILPKTVTVVIEHESKLDVKAELERKQIRGLQVKRRLKYGGTTVSCLHYGKKK